MEPPLAALAQLRGSAEVDLRYRVALLDWLACATAGAAEPAARSARAAGDGLLERVAWAGCAGHVLDFDDTYSPGLVHASAPVAPAALVLGAHLGSDLAQVLDSYAAGFEVTAALARAAHPALYEGGWHPTAVCGTIGAAVACARLLALEDAATESAAALAMLRAGGLRSSFGSQGKALQVGLAAAAGVHAARLAAAGANVPLDAVVRGPAGFHRAFGAEWPSATAEPAVNQNWIKAHPSCLATHSAIEAAEQVRTAGAAPGDVTVIVHPRAREAAALDDVTDGLQAKFSIPYLTAYTLLNGPPRLASFARVDPEARALAGRIAVREDPRLGEMESRLHASGRDLARVEWARGSPARPMDDEQLAAKIRELAGSRLDGVLDDGSAAAADVLAAAGLS